MPRQTSFLNIPFPSPLEEPWQDSIDAFTATVDTQLFSAVTDRNLFITGGGIVLFDLATQTLSWTEPIKLTNFVTGFFQEIPAGSAIILPGQFMFTVQSRGLEDVTGTITLQALIETKLLDRPRGELHVDTVICARFGDTIVFRNGAILLPDVAIPILTHPPYDRRIFNLSEFRSFQHLNEDLLGTADGVRTVFGICRNIDTNLFAVYLDGMRMTPGIDFDILANHRIRFTPAPAVGSRFVLDLYEPPVIFQGVFEETNIWGETPDGVVDGVNDTFTICHPHTIGTLRVYLDGLRMRPTTDYTVINGSTFVFSVPPAIGSVILVDYVQDRPNVGVFTSLFAWNEVPVQNNPTEFQMANAYFAGTTQLYLDGMRMKLGVDYLEGPGPTKITFSVAPSAGSTVLIDYMKL